MNTHIHTSMYIYISREILWVCCLFLLGWGLHPKSQVLSGPKFESVIFGSAKTPPLLTFY